MVDERILPYSNPVVQWISRPRIVPAMWLSGKELSLERLKAGKQGSPYRRRKVVERSESRAFKGMASQALLLLFGRLLRFSGTLEDNCGEPEGPLCAREICGSISTSPGLFRAMRSTLAWSRESQSPSADL